MRLYSGTSSQFLEDTTFNKIADKLRNSFFEHFHYYPPDAEVNSWQNSLRAISMIFHHAKLLDHGIILEYQLPQTSKRLDCLICGRNGHKENSKDPATRRSKDGYLVLVKNIYRVLLSRGIVGCYVYFVDKDTERFFKSRMERQGW